MQEGGIDPDIGVPQLTDPDYKDRPVIREADLRRHLLNQAKVEDKMLESDDTHRSALHGDGGRAREEGRQGLPARLCDQHAEAAAAGRHRSPCAAATRRRSRGKSANERGDRLRSEAFEPIAAPRRLAPADRAAACRSRCSPARSARNISAALSRARCAGGSASAHIAAVALAALAFTAPGATRRGRGSSCSSPRWRSRCRARSAFITPGVEAKIFEGFTTCTALAERPRAPLIS